ncbi:hypothetical protein GCM10027299_12860 [Larkinella ripae]
MNLTLEALQKLNERSRSINSAELYLTNFIENQLYKGLSPEYVSSLADALFAAYLKWKEEEFIYINAETTRLVGPTQSPSPESERRELLYKLSTKIKDGEMLDFEGATAAYYQEGDDLDLEFDFTLYTSFHTAYKIKNKLFVYCLDESEDENDQWRKVLAEELENNELSDLLNTINVYEPKPEPIGKQSYAVISKQIQERLGFVSRSTI